MAQDHNPAQDSRLERLVEGVQDALLATERENAERHIELIAAIRGKADVLGKLNALKSRLARIAKALAVLDAKT
jgi:hypothetical protein